MSATLDRIGLLAAFLTAATWGMTGVFVRLVPALSPLSVTAARLLVALAVAVPLVLWLRRASLAPAALARADAWRLAALLAAYYLIATTAFQLAPVGEVALLLALGPLLVLAWRALRGLPVRRAELAGAALAIGGVGVVMLPVLLASGVLVPYGLLVPQEGLGPAPQSAARATGNLLALLGSVVIASYAAYYRALGEQGRAPDTLAVSLLAFGGGGVGLGLLSLSPAAGFDPAALGATDLLYLLGLGTLSTAVPSIGYAMASSRLPAVVTTSMTLLVPVFAILAAYLFLGERPSATLLPGAVLVLAGLWLVVVGPGLTGRGR